MTDIVDNGATPGVSTLGVLTAPHAGVIRMRPTTAQTQEVVFTRDVLATGNPLLRDCLGGRTALIVVSPSIDRLYGAQIKEYFATERGVGYMVLHCTEASKTLGAAIEVCERATELGLHRMSPIIAIGGGVCTDVCGVAAALLRRGIPHINLPTTVVGLIDAGIGIKNAVNHAGRKSALGAFHAPEYSLLDPSFLATLPRRQLVNGLAEAIKLAVVSDATLFDELADGGVALAEPGAASSLPLMEQVIRRSVTGMLHELAQNPFERKDFRRKVDFGHTFGPYFETASHHEVLHGEAVAMDMALSVEVAFRTGRLDSADRGRILDVVTAVGLPLVWPATSVADLWASLSSIVEHRNGELHLVVPTGIGTCDFVGMGELSPAFLAGCLRELAHGAGQTTASDRGTPS